MSAHIHIEIVYGADNLEPYELWPDGDAPDVITEQDVLDLIEKDGGPSRVITDWGFQPEVRVSIT